MATNDAPTVREILNIESFFKAIAYKLGGYPIKTFSYIATKCGSEFFLLQGRLFLSTGTPQCSTHFESEHIRAGCYALSELKLNASQLVERLASGSLSTPHGKMRFSPNEGSSFLANYDPIHQAGQSTQSRFDILTILGGAAQQYIAQPILDWEL